MGTGGHRPDEVRGDVAGCPFCGAMYTVVRDGGAVSAEAAHLADCWLSECGCEHGTVFFDEDCDGDAMGWVTAALRRRAGTEDAWVRGA